MKKRLLLVIAFALMAFKGQELPNVLIIGDSISIGYTPFVKEALEGKANVVHNEGNAQHTGTGLIKLEEWLGDPRTVPPESILRSSGDNLANFLLKVLEQGTAEEAVARNEVDIGVRIERLRSRTPIVTLYAYRGDTTSEAARRVFVERLQWLKLAEAQIVIQNTLPGYPPPLLIQVEDVGEAKKGDMLATIVPLVLPALICNVPFVAS